METIRLINTNDNTNIANYQVSTAKESKKIISICKPLIDTLAPNLKLETESYIDDNVVTYIVADITNTINCMIQGNK